MSVTIDVVFFDSAGAPLTGLTPTFTLYDTLAGVVTAQPTVVTIDPLHKFTLSATDEVTGIVYILDGGATAFPRYYSGSQDPVASAQPGTTVSVTGVNVFSVTPDLVKKRHFPQWSSFTTNSNPSIATVSEIIDECAATLEARLLQEGIATASLTVTNVAAYLWCRETLRLMAALAILQVATQQAPPLAATWQKQLDARFAELDDKGYLALGGGVSAPSEQPDGPTHFIDSLSLDTSSNDAGASSVDFPFRKSDQL